MVSIINILGMLGLTGGIVGYFVFPSGLKLGLEQFVNLKEDGMVYPLYMYPPIDAISLYYLYEIVNPKQVLMGEPIKVKLRGPYKYKSKFVRWNIKFKNNGEIVKFDTIRKMYTIEEGSSDFDEKFWQLNPILAGVASTVRAIVLDKLPFSNMFEPVIFNSLNLVIDQFKERLIVKRSARQTLNGKKVELLEFITSLADRFGLASLVPPGPPENTFGVVHFQNLTASKMELFVGVGKTKKRFAEVIKWNDQEKIPFWKGKCQLINGTNGELYKPLLKPGKPMKVFLPQLCRTFEIDPVGGQVDIQDGLKAYEYEISSRLFLGARNNPNNKCFCKDLKSYDCQYDGLINMSPCYFDAPIYVTKANLKNVDKRIRATIDENSLTEVLPDKQSFYLDPTTGTVLKLNLTLTAIVKLVRQPYFRDMAKIQNVTYAPFFVTSESVELPPKLTWQIKYLQIMCRYYKPMHAAISAGGTSLLLMKFIANRFF